MEIKEFLLSVSSRDLVLTVNQRLQSYLRQFYDNLQLTLGRNAWESLKIAPLQVWVDKIWEDHSNDTRLLLSDFQELQIWQQCIEESAEGQRLINLTATAGLAKEAWRLINHWLLNFEVLSNSNYLDVQAFAEWTNTFLKKCATYHAISRAEIIKLLIEELKNKSNFFQLPARIFFVGFDDLSPAVESLQLVLSSYVEVQNIEFTHYLENTVQRVTASSKQEEWLTMARWTRMKLHEAPNKVIACIIPTLASHRTEIVQAFEKVFYTNSLQNSTALPFNISAGKGIGQFSIIECILKILALNHNEIDIEDLSYLLYIPFIKGSEQELGARAILDEELRSFGEKKISLHQLVAGNFFQPTRLFFSCLQDFIALQKNLLKKLSLAEWANFFVAQLNAMGWPGERSLNSTEFQLQERFKKLLTEFIQLDYFMPPVSFTKALSILKNLITATLFQPKSEDKPIQILGVLEASGMAFDSLWVAGLDNESWPAPCSPNPFIPIDIQKKLGMPHATPDRELQFSEKLTQRLLNNAREIIFSYAEYDNDRPLRASSLITNYPQMDLHLPPYHSIEQLIFKTKNIEIFVDDKGPSLENLNVSGGSGIFKAQASCPFQSFAKYRLHAEPFGEPQIGLASFEKGLLVHDILANFWTKITSHELLCDLSAEELTIIIEQLIDQALVKIQAKKPYSLKKNIYALERNRLKKLIFNWLQLEKERQPFEVISCERREVAEIAGLNIKVQIDRVDQLANGTQVIIDYKTGKTSLSDWFSERPIEPQLPLYAVLSKQALSGILFAQLRIAEINFKGIATHAGIAPGAITLERLKDEELLTIPELINYWSTHLHQLAKDFREGKASVDPKEERACEYCQLHALCRVAHS